MSLDIMLIDPTATYSTGSLFDLNITHNLGKMAMEAGIYMHLWRPSEIDIKTAKELIKPLEKGRLLLINYTNRFRKLEPENGWGTYEDLLKAVIRYIKACKKYPEALIDTSR